MLVPVSHAIKSLLPRFIGDIAQTPPTFSAVHINGKRAYVEARAGNEVKLESRQVHISDLRLLSQTSDTATFEAECGKGTYIRSIARDMGRELGCYGHISSLRRTFVEPFEEKDAIKLEKLLELEGDHSQLDSLLISPLHSMHSYDHLKVDGDQARRIRLGNRVLIRKGMNPSRDSTNTQDICAVHENSLLAIGDIVNGEFRPRKVLAEHSSHVSQ